MAREPQGPCLVEGCSLWGHPFGTNTELISQGEKLVLCMKRKNNAFCHLPLIAWPDEDLVGSCLVWEAL